MKILFLVPYPTEGPSNRYRVEQYLPYLKEAGIDYTLRPFMSPYFYGIFYKKGKALQKILLFLQSAFKRVLDVARVFKYDVIFIHIEAFPLGPPFIEWIFYKMKKPVIFDFEDAIYLRRKGFDNFFKNPSKFFKIIRMSERVIVCNSYLRNFLSEYNKKIFLLPTSIDTKKFQPAFKDGNDIKKEVIIGWIGSHTTLPFLLNLSGVFKKIAQKHSFTLKIVGAGKPVNIDGVKIINEQWSLDREIDSFNSLDIGVYPLPDNEWSKAKTPFKTIQYMSVGLAVVASPVGGNLDIITDGVNGFLAKTEEEWVVKISMLIENPKLRMQAGAEGRKTVEERFSVRGNAPKYVDILKGVECR